MILLDIPEPENCKDCIFRDYEFNMCFASAKDGNTESAKYVDDYVCGDILKPDWCPASKKLNKVYVITTGSYSDYHIQGVAITEERANMLQRYYSDGWNGDATIEKYFIDALHEDLDDLIPVYCVEISRKGKCSCYRSTWMHERTGETIEDSVYDKSEFGSKLQTNVDSNFSIPYLKFIWFGPAKDEEHAIKIAQDERAKMLEQYYMDHGEEHEQKLKIAEEREAKWVCGMP